MDFSTSSLGGVTASTSSSGESPEPSSSSSVSMRRAAEEDGEKRSSRFDDEEEEEEEEEDVCPICRNPGDSDNLLRYPCTCSGSTKFVHQDCLLQWLNRSNARQCERRTDMGYAVSSSNYAEEEGAIINIGGSSVLPSSYPLFSVYAATKVYLLMFSRSIYLEYKQKGIDVQCQVPLFVATKMSKFKRSSFFIPSAEMYSKASIRMVIQVQKIFILHSIDKKYVV